MPSVGEEEATKNALINSAVTFIFGEVTFWIQGVELFLTTQVIG